MTPIVENICAELRNPEGNGLQEILLQAKLVLEHHRGLISDDLGYTFTPEDYSSSAVHTLAKTLVRFIESEVCHPDVGSAVWALGALYDPRFVPLFRSVLDPRNAYSQWAKDQAWCAISNLGLDANANA